MEKDKIGLGDIVEKTIEVIAPSFAQSKSECVKCQSRKKRLNEILSFHRAQRNK